MHMEKEAFRVHLAQWPSQVCLYFCGQKLQIAIRQIGLRKVIKDGMDTCELDDYSYSALRSTMTACQRGLVLFLCFFIQH